MKKVIKLINDRIYAHKFIIDEIKVGHINYESPIMAKSVIDNMAFTIGVLEDLLADVQAECSSTDEAYEEPIDEEWENMAQQHMIEEMNNEELRERQEDQAWEDRDPGPITEW